MRRERFDNALEIYEQELKVKELRDKLRDLYDVEMPNLYKEEIDILLNQYFNSLRKLGELERKYDNIEYSYIY